MKGYSLLFSLIVLWLTSCISHKNTLLLQDSTLDSSNVDLKLVYSASEYKIQEGDFLDIQIQSPDEKSLIFFNKQSVKAGGSGTLTEGLLYLSSYIVDLNGEVFLPVLGKVEVKGKTTNEVKEDIMSKLEKYYKVSDVSVKMMSFKVTFIGEVSKPKTVFIYNMNTTLFEGLSKVGGITEFTNTHKVTILRKETNDSVKATKVNINKLGFVGTEYYYLRPGDVIYFEPVKYKTVTKNIPLVSFALSISTLVLTIFAISNKN